MPEIEVPCPTCSGTGNMTPGGGRNNLKDRCTTCGGRHTIPACPGESRETSWPFAVPGALQAPSSDAIIREMFGRAIEEHGALADASDAVDALCDQVVDYVRLVSETADAPAAPQPPSSTPGEAERLVGQLIEAARAFGWSVDLGSPTDAHRAMLEEKAARTALLSHISTAGWGEGAGDLAALSAAATQGRWFLDVQVYYDEDGGPPEDHTEGVMVLGLEDEPDSIIQCSGDDARFIVALVNAFRSGCLVERSAADATNPQDQE